MGYNKPSQTSDEVVLSLNNCRRTPSPVARRPQKEAIQTSTQRRELSSGRNSTPRSAPLTPLLKKTSSKQMGKVQRTNAKKKGTNGADTLTHVSDDERNTPSPIRAPGETRHGDERRPENDAGRQYVEKRMHAPARREHEPRPRARSRDAVHDQVLVHAHHAWKAAPYPRSTLLPLARKRVQQRASSQQRCRTRALASPASVAGVHTSDERA